MEKTKMPPEQFAALVNWVRARHRRENVADSIFTDIVQNLVPNVAEALSRVSRLIDGSGEPPHISDILTTIYSVTRIGKLNLSRSEMNVLHTAMPLVREGLPYDERALCELCINHVPTHQIQTAITAIVRTMKSPGGTIGRVIGTLASCVKGEYLG